MHDAGGELGLEIKSSFIQPREWHFSMFQSTVWLINLYEYPETSMYKPDGHP